jgi:hypothetical protein
MLDAFEYKISCLYCGHVGYERVGWLLKHPAFPCPQGCGATIVSPVVELSELSPVSMPSCNDLDLSRWEPKKARRAAGDRTSGRDRNVRGKTPRVRARSPR